jgi:hypothetical protein
MGPADKLNRTYEASNADVAAMRIRMTFTRNTKEGIPMSKFPTPGRCAQIISKRIQ